MVFFYAGCWFESITVHTYNGTAIQSELRFSVYNSDQQIPSIIYRLDSSWQNINNSNPATGKHGNNRMIKDTTIKTKITLTAILICFVVGVYIVYTYLPVHVDWVRNGPPQVGVDWKGAFRRASIELLKGKSPYQITSFYNPPWTLFPLLPIALLSPALGSAVIYVLNFISYLFVTFKLKTNFWLIIIFVLYSGMIANSRNGNIEGILAVGYILPPQIGLFFILAKPQMGIAVAIFWAVESWRTGGLEEINRVFLPVGLAYLASFIIFGVYISSTTQLADVWWNSSIFPEGIPIGLVLLIMAIWKREIKFAIAASPFFSPYLTSHTWAIVWLGLLSLFPQRFQFQKEKVASSNNQS